MGDVLRYPTSRKRPYNKPYNKRFGYRGELPDNVVRLRPPPPPPAPSRTGLIAFHLLAAMLADQTGAERMRIADAVKRASDRSPESAALEDAYELLLDLPCRLEPR